MKIAKLAKVKAGKSVTDTVNLIRIFDANGEAKHDSMLVIPEGMPPSTAVQIVDRAIRKCKRTNPEDFMWDDLRPELSAQGFRVPQIVNAKETW